MSGRDKGYRVAIITVAGISSRFNKGIDESDKVLKCLYTEDDKTDTLLQGGKWEKRALMLTDLGAIKNQLASTSVFYLGTEEDNNGEG